LVKEIPYGELLSVVDTANRYTYSGSVTTPPCAHPVFWNVITKVYPIK
jgi:carbonic anhydrase